MENSAQRKKLLIAAQSGTGFIFSSNRLLLCFGTFYCNFLFPPHLSISIFYVATFVSSTFIFYVVILVSNAFIMCLFIPFSFPLIFYVSIFASFSCKSHVSFLVSSVISISYVSLFFSPNIWNGLNFLPPPRSVDSMLIILYTFNFANNNEVSRFTWFE